MIAETIKKMLTQNINVIELSLIDETHKHAGHPQSNGGHFKLHIVSDDFDGMSLIERHRLIYSVLGDMKKKEIHALSINAKTSKE